MDLDRASVRPAATGELAEGTRTGRGFSVRPMLDRVVVGDVPLLRGETAAARTATSEAFAATSRAGALVITVFAISQRYMRSGRFIEVMEACDPC